MMKRMWNGWPIAAALALTIVLPWGNVAHAQSLAIRDSALAAAIQADNPPGYQNASPPPAKPCNRTRRTVIGAIIGGAAAYPLAWFAYHRFANEANADGGRALATLTMGGAIPLGALIGWNSCK